MGQVGVWLVKRSGCYERGEGRGRYLLVSSDTAYTNDCMYMLSCSDTCVYMYTGKNNVPKCVHVLS